MLKIKVKENNFFREQSKESIEILQELRNTYGDLLKSNLISVKLTQSLDSCYLEIIYKKSHKSSKTVVERVNLNVVSTGFNKPLFPLTNTFEQNIDIFNKSAYDILHLITPMFTNQGVKTLLEQLD